MKDTATFFVRVPPTKVQGAKLMIVGEAPGKSDVFEGRSFVQESGKILNEMLHSNGLLRHQVWITNACKFRPPGGRVKSLFLDPKSCSQPGPKLEAGLAELDAEIAECKPNLIVPLGEVALWACAGTFKKGSRPSLSAWRGSLMTSKWGIKMIPTWHPASTFRDLAKIEDIRTDFKRIAENVGFPELRLPDDKFKIFPSANEVMTTLQWLYSRAEEDILPLAVDLETSKRSHIACIGIAWSETEAICIPLLKSENPYSYWELEQEVEISLMVKKLLTHPRVTTGGQNFAYDQQYFAKEYGYIPRLGFDTMIAQHVLWAGREKGLGYLSSKYCKIHQYWKEEGKEVSAFDEKAWRYNCKDAVRTYEIREALTVELEHAGLWHIFAFRMELDRCLVRIMLRGIEIDLEERRRLGEELIQAIEKISRDIEYVTGVALNVKSPKQMCDFFYRVMDEKPLYNKDGGLTCDEEALDEISKRTPELRPLINMIHSVRSASIFLANFVQAGLDRDNKMRCQFGTTGTSTYRLNATKNALGGGANLQTIPKGDEDKKPSDLKGVYVLPNVRKIFKPRRNYSIADVDLAGADAQVVAWTAKDEKLKKAFRAGLKIHTVNSKDIFGETKAGKDGKNEPYYHLAKMGVHATNYGAHPPRLAEALDIPIMEAINFQNSWFRAHPEIKQWHERVLAQLYKNRTLTNRFGYRRHFPDRIESILPEALAWEPQSTIAHVSELALVMIRHNIPEIEVLMQVHDSLVFEYPTIHETRILTKLYTLLHSIVIPFEDPLTIPWGLKTSEISWGHCKDRVWPKETSKIG